MTAEIKDPDTNLCEAYGSCAVGFESLHVNALLCHLLPKIVMIKINNSILHSKDTDLIIRN